VRVRPRSRRAWLVITARALAAVLWAIAAATFHRPVEAYSFVAGGLVLYLATLRPKARLVPGALYTSAADRIADDGKRFPGQLSLSTRRLAWSPSRYSLRHGQEAISIDASDCVEIILQRGFGLLSVILTVVLAEGATLNFGTRSSRRLTRTLDRFQASRSA
jgi:hypothetical protein